MHELSDELIEYVLNSAINNPYFNAKKVNYDIKKNFKSDLTLHQFYLILRFILEMVLGCYSTLPSRGSNKLPLDARGAAFII